MLVVSRYLLSILINWMSDQKSSESQFVAGIRIPGPVTDIYKYMHSSLTQVRRYCGRNQSLCRQIINCRPIFFWKIKMKIFRTMILLKRNKLISILWKISFISIVFEIFWKWWNYWAIRECISLKKLWCKKTSTIYINYKPRMHAIK